MTLAPTFRYERISSKAYEHPADRAATSALHAVPLMDVVIKRLTDVAHERRFRQILVGNAVRVGENQIPDLWGGYRSAAYILDIEAPEFYVTQTPMANAMTVGAKRPLVIIASGLAGSYDHDEIKSVLGHELGHVLSEHYYYTTALVLLSRFLRGSVPTSLSGLPVRALYTVLLEWSRTAELSSDRAGALVMADPLVVCRVLMRMAGGALPGMNLDAFITQATEYHEEDDLFARWSRAWVELGMTHPFAVRRVRELINWVSAGDFDRIRSGNYVRRGEEAAPSSEFEAAATHYKERFTQVLERATGGVQKMVGQFDEWLKRTRPERRQEQDSEDWDE
ncbi:MAG: M48 family metallopeptidase [Acidimicrobiales bacterium]